MIKCSEVCILLRIWFCTALVGLTKRSQYFCKYCEIINKIEGLNWSSFTQNLLKPKNTSECGPQRTTSYESAVHDLQTEGIQDYKGIKVNTVFNALKSFHVCHPGLPPCLGHDIFDDVLSYNVAFNFKYFIKKTL